MFENFGYAGRPPAAALAALAAVLLPGCASITGSELQLLSLQAFNKDGAPVAGADCRLSNDKGTWYAKPPASPTVARSAEDLNVNCEAVGQTSGSVRAVSRANAGMAGNILFGGVIGVIIDHNKGTAYDYPSTIRVVFGTSTVVDKKDDSGAVSASTPAPAPAPESSAPGSVAAAAPNSLSPGGPDAPASATLPRAGANFRYLWTEQKYSRRKQEFQINVTGVDGWMVMESFSVDGGRPARYENWAQSPTFASRLLAESQTLVEFAPYLQTRGDSGPLRVADPSGYSTDAMGSAWSVSIQTGGPERVTVPAGTFNALRVEVQGSRNMSNTTIATSGVPSRFVFAAWYVPELSRYVKSRHETWNSGRLQIGDELVELLEYRPR